MTELNLEKDELEEYLDELDADQRGEVIQLMDQLNSTPMDNVRSRSRLVALIYDSLGLVTDDELEILNSTQDLSPDEARSFILERGKKLGYIEADEDDLTLAQGFIDS